MKFVTTFFFLLGAGLASAGCDANNCARQITGTRLKIPNLTSRQADCASFMTTTVYATPTATSTPPSVYDKRKKRDRVVQRDPVTVSGAFPAYATDCAGASAYSSACSCWGYTATVITQVTPVTTVVQPTPTCAQGLEWAFFTFVEGPSAAPGILPLNPDAIPTGTAAAIPDLDYTGLEYSGGTDAYTPTAILYGKNVDASPFDFYGVEWRGYFYPQVTGTYTFSLDKADDIGLAWLGPNAVSGFTVANSLLSGYAYSSDRPYPLNTTTVDAVAGVPVPFRLMWANAELQGAFEFTVTDPNSVVVLGPLSTPNPTFVQSCSNDVLAPPWVAWQSE